MNLHEYQGKQLFAEYGLPVSAGHAVDTPQGAVEAAQLIGGERWVVKAQVAAARPVASSSWRASTKSRSLPRNGSATAS